MNLRNRLILTLFVNVTMLAQLAMADKVDDDIAGVLMSVSGYGQLKPITGGVVGDDVVRTLIPQILDEAVAKTLRPQSPYESEFKPRIPKRRGRRMK